MKLLIVTAIAAHQQEVLKLLKPQELKLLAAQKLTDIKIYRH